MMRTLGRTTAVILLILLLTPQVILAATLAKNQDLDFGRIISLYGSGTVTIAPSGSRTFSGAVKLIGGVFSPAKFTIQGTPLAQYQLTLPASVTIISGGDYINISNVSSSVPVAGQLPASGVLSFTVGGTLEVTGGKRPSIYRGALTISVN